MGTPGERNAPALLRGVDLAAFAVAFAMRLRGRGLPVGLTAVETFARALAEARPKTKQRLYWTARVSLVSRQSEIELFDAVFAAVFEDTVLGVDPNARRAPAGSTPPGEDAFTSVAGPAGCEQDGSGLPWATLPPAVEPSDEPAGELTIAERLPSGEPSLAEVPFDQLTGAQQELLGRWLQAGAGALPKRRTRRMTAGGSGHRIDVRSTLARSRRTGWEPVELVHVRPVDKPRRVVMLCDVSQSMQAQCTAYLHLMRALALNVDAEVFAFATSLTRLTGVLAHRTADVAIEHASARVRDRFGGTRIATNLQTLLTSRHSGVVRGAVVLIGSDGWDSDPPERLAAAMARLHRRAYRVIWLNPRASAPGFEPRVASMAAALPYCDSLLPADTFGSLAAVIAQICRPVSSTASRESTGGTGRR